jgi:hypothetical protein
LGKSRRKAYLKDNPKFMKHQSFGGIIDRKHVVAFVTVLRVEELLIGGSDDDDDYHEPRVVIRAPDKTSLEKLLTTLKSSRDAEFVMIDAPVFAYEPVLRCLQSTVELPLWQELFAISGEEIEAAVRLSEVAPLDLIRKIENKGGHGLQSTLSLPKPVDLDASQLGSLLAGLRQSVSLTPRFLMPLPGGPLPISTSSLAHQVPERRQWRNCTGRYWRIWACCRLTRVSIPVQNLPIHANDAQPSRKHPPISSVAFWVPPKPTRRAFSMLPKAKF